MNHGLCPTIEATMQNAPATDASAYLHRTCGKRISSAAVIALPGQKSAVPPGTRVSWMEAKADTSSANPTSISAIGALDSAPRCRLDCISGGTIFSLRTPLGPRAAYAHTDKPRFMRDDIMRQSSVETRFQTRITSQLCDGETRCHDPARPPHPLGGAVRSG